MHRERAIGLLPAQFKNDETRRQKLQLYINLKLASSGQPIVAGDNEEFLSTAQDLLKSYREKNRLLSDYYCPADYRIQQFLQRYFSALPAEQVPSLPGMTFVLDRHGVARELSIPLGEDEFHSDIVNSYRVRQGVLHNPASDRRTTKGSFHISEGGLPIPGDKKAVPVVTYAALLNAALDPPDDLLTIPFTANREKPAKMFVSLLLRPTVCPEIPGQETRKYLEIRFFAPANLVSNLDFVESIFGNGGNPFLAENDAGLDVEHWTGHTGCVILAPHLTRLSKQELGLPHYDDASERQRRDGMCWKNDAELYNDGMPFKITGRDESGVIVTILADNYYGYCKKEVKTQIGFSANLYGLAEEEHAGGALAFPRRNHGIEYGVDSSTRAPGYSFADVVERYGSIMDLQDEGYAIDKRHPEVFYVPQDLRVDLEAQSIQWEKEGRTQRIRLKPGITYIQPNGYKLEMQQHPSAPSWRLIGTEPEGTFCHKPCTVSGGGKSEISKSIDDAVIYGPLFVDDLQTDLDTVEVIFNKDYSDCLKKGFEYEDRDPTRKLLSVERSLGSVIKLLTPSPSYRDEYNDWLATIPPRILALVFIIKRFYQDKWGNDWRRYISVDEIDGASGHEVKLYDRRIIASYLRVGFDEAAKWRIFKVRQDFIAAEKIQMEDDITASIVVPPSHLAGCRDSIRGEHSVKLVSNCEYRLFQRPDDAIIPGFDTQAEYDISQPGNFLANFEPLDHEKLGEVVEDVLTFSNYSQPMKSFLQDAYDEQAAYVVSSAHPRIVDGKPSKNPRYLQFRQDLVEPVRSYVADIGARLHRKLELDQPLCHPVDAILTGRRNNPPETSIRPLAVYNPIHYQELPELFMDFVCSLTGKSPSTTGAGSEGALTKGPFNALRPTIDLNNALVSYILTGYAGYSSSAGYIGAHVRVDHDISLLVPEIWSRLTEQQRKPAYMIERGFLERLEDFEYEGRKIPASRLGYRITDRFVHGLLGKIFDNPYAVFTEAILKPETQDLAVFVDGIENIVEAQQKVAQQYLDDGSIDDACPPLRALLYIMATGAYEGKDVHHPDVRAMFTRENLFASDWYQERLNIKQRREMQLWQRHIDYLSEFTSKPGYADVVEDLQIEDRLAFARNRLNEVQSERYLEKITGTIGADPL
jgi:hypothetical protein